MYIILCTNFETKRLFDSRGDVNNDDGVNTVVAKREIHTNTHSHTSAIGISNRHSIHSNVFFSRFDIFVNDIICTLYNNDNACDYMPSFSLYPSVPIDFAICYYKTFYYLLYFPFLPPRAFPTVGDVWRVCVITADSSTPTSPPTVI